MKVKDLILILKDFDPESDIWINYDGYQSQVPDFIIATPDDCVGDIKVGDIVHLAY